MNETLLHLWQHTVRAAPAAAAVFDAHTGRVWTRLELATFATAWRAQHGARTVGQIVVFSEPNGPEWLRVFLGLLAADATIVALDPGEPVAAQRAMASGVGAAFLWHAGKLEAVGTPRLRQSRNVVRLIKLTSGSTGMPRALRFTDAQLVADGRQVCASMDIRPTDLNFGCIPFGHSYGLGNLVVPLIVQGTAIVSGSPVLPQALAAGIEQWRPTVFPAVPALLRALAEAEIAPGQLRSLRTVISAGAPLAAEVARAFHGKFGLKIHNFYGSSETGGIAYDRSGDATLKGRGVGKPMEGVRLNLGPGKRFSVASAAVGGRGVFRPPDRGELNVEGELVLLGRAGRMLKIAGRRLDPAEVESALRELPGIRDAFVALHPDRADTLAAVVASDEPATTLRDLLRERMAAWKVPKKLVVLPAFPLTARGKPDLRRLRALLE